MIIMGIDPGYAIVGYGIIDHTGSKFSVLDFGAVTTPSGMDFAGRLVLIYDELEVLIKKHKPEAMGIEKLFFNSNQKTVIDVSQARGAILLSARKNGLQIYEYTPLQIKQAVVGYGRAEKAQVMEMTRMILGLDKAPKPDDTADALAVAICHAHSSGSRMGQLLKNTRK